MSIMMISFFTFLSVLAAGALFMKPVLSYYVHNYEVRLRPRKQELACSGEMPRESALLSLCTATGSTVLTLLPGLADRRSVQLLTMANYRTPQHLAIFTGIKSLVAACVLALGLMAAMSNPINLVLSIPAALLGWLVPNFFLAGRVRRRKQLIVQELPVILDLLLVCAQAGLGLLMGVEKVAVEIEGSCPVMAGELKQLLKDVKMFAKSVPQALHEMGERCGVDELINMAAALIAAEAKGADISYPLQQQSSALRDRLKRKREEEAGRVPVKMVPVIMVFIMPLILAPMLGPAIMTILLALRPILDGLGS